jgi:hypothetical protein
MPKSPGRVSLLVLLLTGVLQASQTAGTVPPPVRQIDHVMIRTGNPEDLYGFLTEILHLPVAWPLVAPREGVMTGGVGVGNVNLEAIRFPGQTELRPQLLGLALEPAALDSSIRELSSRGVAMGPRREILGSRPDGSKGPRGTNVTLQQFSDSDNPADATVHVFLSEYSSAYLDVPERRARLRQQLTAGGGPLGIVDVKEVVIGVRDLTAGGRLWQRLLDPASPSGQHAWQVGDGPAIRLVSAPRDRMEALTIRVASLDKARTFLRQNQLTGAETPGQVTIKSPKLGDVDIRLVGK